MSLIDDVETRISIEGRHFPEKLWKIGKFDSNDVEMYFAGIEPKWAPEKYERNLEAINTNLVRIKRRSLNPSYTFSFIENHRPMVQQGWQKSSIYPK